MTRQELQLRVGEQENSHGELVWESERKKGKLSCYCCWKGDKEEKKREGEKRFDAEHEAKQQI